MPGLLDMLTLLQQGQAPMGAFPSVVTPEQAAAAAQAQAEEESYLNRFGTPGVVAQRLAGGGGNGLGRPADIGVPEGMLPFDVGNMPRMTSQNDLNINGNPFGLIPGQPNAATFTMSQAPVMEPLPPPVSVATPKVASVDDDVLPDNATLAAGGPMPGALAAAATKADPAKPGFFERLGRGISDNSDFLIALGAGMMGKQSLGQGLSEGLRTGLVAGNAQEERNIKLAGQNATVAALRARGVPESALAAAAGNPALLQQLALEAFKPKTAVNVGGKLVQQQADGTYKEVFSADDKAPTIKDFKLDGGIEVTRQWNPDTKTWDDLPGGYKGSNEGQFVMGPGGKKIAIPEGADPKAFRKRISEMMADAAAGKRTETQQKADQFATRMEGSEKLMAGLESQGTGAGGVWGAMTDSILPGWGASLVQSADYQRFSQAKSQFITALLRQESGAAIGWKEFTRYDKEFFPQPGDAAEVIAQKRQARAAATAAMRRGSGPGWRIYGEDEAAPAGTLSGKTADGISWSAQ